MANARPMVRVCGSGMMPWGPTSTGCTAGTLNSSTDAPPPSTAPKVRTDVSSPPTAKPRSNPPPPKAKSADRSMPVDVPAAPNPIPPNDSPPITPPRPPPPPPMRKLGIAGSPFSDRNAFTPSRSGKKADMPPPPNPKPHAPVVSSPELTSAPPTSARRAARTKIAFFIVASLPRPARACTTPRDRSAIQASRSIPLGDTGSAARRTPTHHTGRGCSLLHAWDSSGRSRRSSSRLRHPARVVRTAGHRLLTPHNCGLCS